MLLLYHHRFREGVRTQSVSYIFQGVFEGGLENVSLHFESTVRTLPTKTTPGGRRDPERGLQSWFRPAKPETRNPKPETDSEDLTSSGPIETRNPKPETRNQLWRLNFPRTDRNPKPETRNPKPTLTTDRNPKPETRNPKLTLKTYPSPGPIETRNPKPTAKVGFNRRNPKPETRNRQRKWVSSDETRNPKPETRNPKPTLKTYAFPRTDRNPKPETRNPKPTAKVGFNRRNPKPETRNPKPETDSNPTFGWLSGSELPGGRSATNFTFKGGPKKCNLHFGVVPP